MIGSNISWTMTKVFSPFLQSTSGCILTEIMAFSCSHLMICSKAYGDYLRNLKTCNYEIIYCIVLMERRCYWLLSIPVVTFSGSKDVLREGTLRIIIFQTIVWRIINCIVGINSLSPTTCKSDNWFPVSGVLLLIPCYRSILQQHFVPPIIAEVYIYPKVNSFLLHTLYNRKFYDFFFRKVTLHILCCIGNM
jgi:hypothetical protein